MMMPKELFSTTGTKSSMYLSSALLVLRGFVLGKFTFLTSILQQIWVNSVDFAAPRVISRRLAVVERVILTQCPWIGVQIVFKTTDLCSCILTQVFKFSFFQRLRRIRSSYQWLRNSIWCTAAAGVGHWSLQEWRPHESAQVKVEMSTSGHDLGNLTRFELFMENGL